MPNPLSAKDREVACAGEDLYWRRVEAERRAACSQFIMDGVKNARFTKEQVIAAYGGKVTKELIEQKGCDVARSFGFSGKLRTESPTP